MLIERCNKFIGDTGLAVTRFCRNINLSVTAFNQWRKGELNLKDETLNRIENYLAKFGY